MSQYYFVAASLPILLPEEKPTISINSFLETAQLHLTKKDFEQLLLSTTEMPISTEQLKGLSKTYWLWEKSLKNELVKLRASRLGLSPEVYLVDEENVYGTHRIATEAFKIDSPLEAELYLISERLNYLDSLLVGHYFDITFLIIYYLKLQVLERASYFDSEIGFENYKKIYKNILESYETQEAEK